MAAPESSASDAGVGAALAQLLALALWLGGALFFASVVAPAAFSVLPARELAGALVGRVLPVLFLVGLVVGVVVAGLELLGRGRRFAVGRAGGGLAMAIACGIAQIGIAPRIAALRAGFTGPLAELPLDDPARVAFQRLHMLSVAWLGVAMLAALAAGVLAVLIVRRQPLDTGRTSS